MHNKTPFEEQLEKALHAIDWPLGEPVYRPDILKIWKKDEEILKQELEKLPKGFHRIQQAMSLDPERLDEKDPSEKYRLVRIRQSQVGPYKVRHCIRVKNTSAHLDTATPAELEKLIKKGIDKSTISEKAGVIFLEEHEQPQTPKEKTVLEEKRHLGLLHNHLVLASVDTYDDHNKFYTLNSPTLRPYNPGLMAKIIVDAIRSLPR